MKILLEINDEKAFHLLEVLKSIPYVKAQKLTDHKAEVLSEVKKAVNELNQIRTGDQVAKDVNAFLDEI